MYFRAKAERRMITKAAQPGRAHCDEENEYAKRNSHSSRSTLLDDEGSDDSDVDEDSDLEEVAPQPPKRKKGGRAQATAPPDIDSATATFLAALAENIKEDTAERRQRRLGA